LPTLLELPSLAVTGLRFGLDQRCSFSTTIEGLAGAFSRHDPKKKMAAKRKKLIF
jgi:hypothetical protein